jgi:hypothetical protein
MRERPCIRRNPGRCSLRGLCPHTPRIFPRSIGHITLDAKQTGTRSAGNPHAACDEAGTGNGFTVRILRHSQRKRGETDRLDLRNAAPVLDPTFRGGYGNGGIMRSPLSAIALLDCRRFKLLKGNRRSFTAFRKTGSLGWRIRAGHIIAVESGATLPFTESLPPELG